MSRIKLFTNEYFDGVGCAIIAKTIWGDEVDICYSDAKYIENDIDNIEDEYDKVFVICIPISYDLEEKLNKLVETNKMDIQFISNKEEDMKFQNRGMRDWVYIRTYQPIYVDKKACGSSLFFNFLKINRLINEFSDYTQSSLEYLANLVRLYVTEEWIINEDKHESEVACRLFKLFELHNRDEFIDEIVEMLNDEMNPFPYDFTSSYNKLLNN